MIPVLIDCDPGQDDALALLLALGEPRARRPRRDRGGGKPDARQDDGERAPRPRARRPDGYSGRRRRGRPLAGELVVAADAHGETGLDGADLPPPSTDPVPEHAMDFLAAQLEASDRAGHACRARPADERCPPPRGASRGGGEDRPRRAHGRRDLGGQPDAVGGVQHLDRPRSRRAASSRAGST